MMWTPSSVERKFELRALPNYAREQTIEAILRATALVCVVLLLSSLGLAQKLVTARACIPFNFWAQGQEFKAGDYVFDNALPGSATIRRKQNLDPLMTELRIIRDKLLTIGSEHISEKEIKGLADREASVLAKLIVASARLQSKIYRILSREQQRSSAILNERRG
jgi:hypothetical protein